MSDLGPRSPRSATSRVAPASRVRRRPAYRDPRLLVGLALIAISSIAGSKAWAAADRTVPVWSITSGLSAGSTLTADDLDVVAVRLDETASRYVGAASDPVGQTLGRDLSAGELLPLAALSDAVDAGMLLTVPVDAAHAPVGLRRGDRVDVYVTPRSDAGRAGATELVLPSAVVDTVDSNDQRFGGSGEAIGVVLSVPQPVVERLVAGARRGDVDLVLVPGQR